MLTSLALLVCIGGGLIAGVFVGTAVLATMCVIAAFFPWGTARSHLLLTAGLVYLLGSFGVTAACNVPRNKRLAVMAADSVQAGAYWPVYVSEWLRWNHVRTIASVVSSASAALALAC